MKTKAKETALSPFRQYNKNPQQNLSKDELGALASLCKNKDIIIQKFDKGNCVAIFDKRTYNKILAVILNPITKNKCTVKDSFQLAEEICGKHTTLSMCSLEVDSPFTKNACHETFDITSLKTLILSKVLQNQNVNKYYV